MMKRTFFFILVLKGLVGHHRTFNFSFFGISDWGIDLNYCDIEWFALEAEIILSLLRLHPSTAFQTFVDYEKYSISSKEFLPSVVDTIVI